MNTIVLSKTISVNNSVKQEASPTIINIKNGFFSNLIEIFSMSNLASQDGLNTESTSGPNFIFSTVFLLLTLAGIISNLIVTLTYKFCDKKACSMNPSTNLNLNHRISIKNEENLIKRSSFNSKSTVNRRNTTTGGKLLTNSCNENNKNLLVPPKRRVSIANESQYDDNHNSVVSENNNFDNPNANKNLHPKSIMSSMHKSNNNTLLNESANNSANLLAHNQSVLLSLGTYNLGYNRMKRCSYFILSLGCCDLSICSLSMPLILVFQSGCLDAMFRSSLYSDAWCKLAHFLVQIPIALEIEILLTIAIDRYTSVFHPMNLNVSDRIKLILVAQMLTSSALSLPNLLFYASASSSSSQSVHHSSEAKNASFTASSSSYCAVKSEYLALYGYYQIGLFVLFVANLIIISVCYLRVYKHVYKASKTQRRESMATNSSLLQLPYSNPSWQGGSTLSSSYVRNQIINSTFSIGRNFESQSEKSYRLYSKSWLFCCKKLIGPKEKYEEEKMESLKQQSLADMIESKKRSSFRRKSFDSRLQERAYSKINKDEYVLDEVDENDGSNEEKKSSYTANKMPLFELCGEKYSSEDVTEKKSNEKDLETEILDKFDEKAELKQPSQAGQNNKLAFNHARRTSCPVSVDRHLREALLKTSLKESSKLSGSISSIYNQTVNKKLELVEITHRPSSPEAKPTNIVHPNRSDSIKYLRKNTSGLMSRIRRFSENPHSSILLKQGTLSFTPSPTGGFVSPNQNMRTISSSLFELNSNNGTLSHRVSIRKHTSRPLRHSKTARVLGVATLAFALTWSPYWYYVLKTNANTTSRRVVNEPNEFLYVDVSTMGDYLLKRFLKNSFYLNYVLNPIFYSFVNQRFRRNVASLFRKLTKCVLNLVCCCLINKKGNSSKKSNFYSSTSKRSRSRLNSTAKSDAHTGSASNFKSVFSKNYKYLSTCCSKTKLDANKSLNVNPDTQKINVTVKHTVEDGKTTNHKEADAGLLVVANDTSLSKIIKLN
jgi:hypothetical protein